MRTHLPILAAALAGFVHAGVLADEYRTSILPILKERCNGCHSTERQKGELDLERFAGLAEIQREPLVWEHVLEQIESGEMPPKKEPPLSAEEKARLTQWTRRTLEAVALANAGDPGPVVLRRLSNMEYTYTVRDLTGVPSLDPAREFPADGAAGEGFTNAGAALVMSPALLTKYLDAAKEVANHAVLLPDGLRFSASTSARDWTDEVLAGIRAFYARFSAEGNATAVNLQGIRFDTNAGGRLPVERYLDAVQGRAGAGGLNARYLATLKQALTDTRPSLLLDPLRAKFRAGTLSRADIEAWQQVLWRFASVGHIGKEKGPKSWQEPVSPLAERHEMRVKLAAPQDGGDVRLYLAVGDAGDGPEHDAAVWENARLVLPGRADLPLRDVRAAVQRWQRQRRRLIDSVAPCLEAAHAAQTSRERPDLAALAQAHGVDAELLAGWLECLGLGTAGPAKLEPLLKRPVKRTPDYDFIQGWAGEQALSVLANSSDTTVRTPGTMPGRSVATHPSPTQASVIAWRSPVTGMLRLQGSVQDAHTACGNGVTAGAAPVAFGPFERVDVRTGDAVALVIGPRDGSHICDLTTVNLSVEHGRTQWDLARDVSPDILAGNPHADRHGHPAVWHFLSQPAAAEAAPAIPAGSLLARWRQATEPAERRRLARELQQLLGRDPASLTAGSPDRLLHKGLLSARGPLLAAALRAEAPAAVEAAAGAYGLDPAQSLTVRPPSLIEVTLPAWLAEGAEFAATGRLAEAEGSVQMQVLTERPAALQGIAAGKAASGQAKGRWSDNNWRTEHSVPVLTGAGSAARRRFEAAFAEFRALFPVALCYTKIVPVDEVVTLTLFHREDEPLRRLMLDEAQAAELDRLWAELRFVSEAPLKQVDVFEQLYQFATQDASPSAFEPMRAPILRAAAEFRAWRAAAEPRQVQAVLDLAGRAWRRPLSEAARAELLALYEKLRGQELPHDSAVRMLIARVLVAPAFLYRGEKAAPGTKPAPVNDWELATRLSYFLGSSAPDDELRAQAAAGRLRDPEVLVAQARRLLKDDRVRRLATEFGCQWLHVRDLATLDEKSERHFPTFAGLRASMQEEAVRFFMDLFQADRPVLSLLEADHSFVDGPLAEHYGLPAENAGWRRVDGLRAHGRGGILGFAGTLARQSGASRTSPILRGTWLTEVILGEKLPVPPKGVPVLPEEAPQGLTERQLTERHSRDPNCAGCHRRIDPFGFALEGFDAIGRARSRDAAGLPIDTRAELPDGTRVDGIDGLRTYLLRARREAFLRQFCRKLLGYALGRSVQLSDRPLIDGLVERLLAGEGRVGTVIDGIVRSPQFREVRGRDQAPGF